MMLYAVTIFLSAFLLFQIQPIAGKMILPWFGGSASVWSACMVLFQTILLLGYGYAHWLHEKLSPKRQALVHTLLLLASAAVLPIALDPSWKGATPEQPALAVLAVLGASVGLPYLVVSTTGPLLQAWYARSHATGMPYRLYALSNLASMLALLTYPLVVEPNLMLNTQRYAWSAGYAVFAILCAITAWSSARRASAVAPDTEQGSSPARPSVREVGLWVLLAACASILLLAITRHTTQDVAPVPFLWILPLSLYLLSFIVCFEAPRGYHRPTFIGLLVLTLGAVAYDLDGGFDVVPSIAILSLSTFVFCMFCHGELARRKPHPRHLTLFYLALAVGGALGGVFVGLVAPAVFTAYYEFPIGLAACAVLAMVVLWRDSSRAWRGALALAALAYCFWLVTISQSYVQDYRSVVRNFYSQLRVDDVQIDGAGIKRKLYHGRITHGEQFLAEELQNKPTAYYCHECGIGRMMLSLDPTRAHHVGIVGLGAGTLAAYGRKGDDFRIYEINDQVVDIARSEFSYLEDSEADIEIVLGDGRLNLEEESPQGFDALIIDAFSGDSIPTHLLTLEAVGSYLRHLKPDGVLALHITNHHLDLRPVVASAAEEYDRVAVINEFEPADEDLFCRKSDWAFIAKQERAFSLPMTAPLKPSEEFRPWSDDYTNLLSVLKL